MTKVEKKITITTCDSCKDEISQQNDNVYQGKWYPSLEMVINDENYISFKDLCSPCYRVFQRAVYDAHKQIMREREG